MFSVKRGLKKKNKEQLENPEIEEETESEELGLSAESPIDEVEEEEEEEEKEEISKIYTLGYKLLHRRVKSLFPKFAPLEEKLLKSGSPVPYEVYITGAVFMGLIAGIVGLAIGIVIALLVNINPAAFKFVLPLPLALLCFMMTFGMMYMKPKMSIGGRAKKVEEEMPYFMGYMSTLAASGQMLEQIFSTIAAEESKEEIVRLSRLLVRDVDVFGMDVVTAIEESIKRSPADSWSELLEGLISTIQTGGSLQQYFTATAEVHLAEKKMLLEKMTANLGIISELYTILLIVFPLMAIVMLAIMALMSPDFMGFKTTTVMKGITYIIVPLFGIMMLMMMDGMVPKR